MQERGNDKGAGTILVLCSSILLTTPLFFRSNSSASCAIGWTGTFCRSMILINDASLTMSTPLLENISIMLAMQTKALHAGAQLINRYPVCTLRKTGI